MTFPNSLRLILVCIAAIACQSKSTPIVEDGKKSATCEVANPAEDLPWLKEIVTKAKKEPDSPHCVVQNVQQGTYQGKTIYIPTVSGALCDVCAGIMAYNCEGKVVLSCDTSALSTITDLKSVWTLR